MKHGKLIAPVIITILVIIYFVGFAVASAAADLPILLKIGGILLPLMIAIASVFVFIERIKEIRSGEEDDLSQY